MQALLDGNKAYTSENESCQNLLARYEDIEEIFPDDLKGPALPYFIYWLKGKVILLEIDTPSEDAAHTIFLTMNDRGLSLNSAEMLKAFIIQQVGEDDRNEVNKIWQKNINQIKNAYNSASSGSVKSEDVDFISTWMRAKYANSIRETKKGAEVGIPTGDVTKMDTFDEFYDAYKKQMEYCISLLVNADNAIDQE